MCNGIAISDPGWPSIFTVHFETLIPRPALCNARARIYGGIRAATARCILILEISYDRPTESCFLLSSGAGALPVLGAKSGIDGIRGNGARGVRLQLSPDRFETFSNSAYAGVSNAGASATQPVGFADMVERVKPSVISVKVTMKEQGERRDANKSDDDGADSPMERFFRQFGGPNGSPGARSRGRHGEMMGQGSGFFISSDGYAVTNNHVVDGADKVEVTTDAGKTYIAKVIGTDPRTDVALIKVEGSSDFPFAKLSEGKARVGDWVLAVGNPFGLGGTVTAGIVSASGRDIGSGPYDDFIQIDAPVNKGNSGGPAFNMQGEVVGVNTAIYSPSGGSVGIAFRSRRRP